MKTLFKLFVALIIIGIIVSVAGFWLLDFKVDKFKALAINDEMFTFHEYNSTEIPVQIETDLRDSYLVVKKSANEEIKITYYSAEEYHKVTMSADDNKIKVYTTEKDKLFNWRPFLASEKVLTVTIEIPSSYDKDLTLKTTNGFIKVENQAVKDIKIKSTNGVIKLNEVKADKVTIDTTNALIEVSKTECSSITAKSTNGAIKVLESIIAGTLNLKTTNGLVSVKSTEVNKLEMNTTNGKVESDELICSDITAKTTNGTINLKIVGNKNDYKVSYSTTNGDSHIDDTEYSSSGTLNSHCSKSVSAKTTNGTIYIRFI